MLQEGLAHSAHVAVALSRRDVGGAQFDVLPPRRRAGEDFVQGDQHLAVLHGGSEIAEVRCRAGRVSTAGFEHSRPVGPRDAVRRAGVLVREGRLDGDGQGGGPASATSGCRVRHQRHGSLATSLVHDCGHRLALRRPDQRAVPAHQGAQGGGG